MQLKSPKPAFEKKQLFITLTKAKISDLDGGIIDKVYIDRACELHIDYRLSVKHFFYNQDIPKPNRNANYRIGKFHRQTSKPRPIENEKKFVRYFLANIGRFMEYKHSLLVET